MELKHLRYFVAAVEEGSLQKAAAKLAVAQPALSRRIQDLEASLGCRLLLRNVRGVTPTPAGRSLYREALQVLDKVADTMQMIRRIGLEQGRESRFGVIQSVRKYDFIHQAVAAHTAQNPGNGVALTRGASWFLAEELREGRLDATLLYERHMGPARFGERLIHKERYVLALHPAHALAAAGPIALAALAGEPFIWVLARHGVDSHDLLLQHCRFNGLDPVIGRLAKGPEELFDLVSVSEGMCLTPVSTVLTTPPGRLVFRLVPDLKLELDLTLAWNEPASSALVQSFLAQLHDAIDRHQTEINAGRADWAQLDGERLVRTS